jgi:glutathione synthase
MIEEAEAWSADNGLLMISPSGEMRPAPISLFPAPVPSSAFLEVRDLASVWNTLYHRIVWRDAFIEKTLEQAAYNDQFTNRLLEIYASVGRENMTKIQPFVMGIFRSDYMLHCQDGHESVFKQVEMNTISAAFAHLGAKVSRFHQFMASKFPDDERYHFHLPNNSSVETIVDTIHQAFELHPSKNSLKTAMMIIVQPGERNVVDQRGIEYALLSKHRHITIRRTLQEIKENARIDEATNNLVIDGYVVLVAYFRAGYTPKDYPSEKEWEARVLIEKSSAIKCPNIAWHLAGAKRIQQELSLSSVLSSFSCDSYDFEALLNSYTAKQWNFNDPETAKEIIENACSNTEDFVLKPQR